jgi:hypothetical protein
VGEGRGKGREGRQGRHGRREGKNDIKQREHQFRKSKHYIKIVISCKLTPSKREYVKKHHHYMKGRDKKGKKQGFSNLTY